jgi:hypothetical protein
MPRPVYSLFAEKISIDQESNLVSLFGVIEKLDIVLWRVGTEVPPQKKLGILGGKLISVWGKIPGDNGKKFEFEIDLEFPGGHGGSTGVTPWEFPKDAIFHRFITEVQIPPMPESGILSIITKVRRKGSKTWQRQVTEIPVNVTIHLDRELPRPKRTNGKH